VTSKRRRTGAKYASLESVSGYIRLEGLWIYHTCQERLTRFILQPQYAFPECWLSLQTVFSSHKDPTLQAPLNVVTGPSRHGNPTTSLHPEPSIPVHSRSESVHLALDAHREVQNHSPFPPLTDVDQSEELLRTTTPTRQSLNRTRTLHSRQQQKILARILTAS
jgi:hypothetical protein